MDLKLDLGSGLKTDTGLGLETGTEMGLGIRSGTSSGMDYNLESDWEQPVCQALGQTGSPEHTVNQGSDTDLATDLGVGSETDSGN